MTNSPFDDPEFRAQMERMGVRHSPGMADGLMKELAPLLRAEGVDLDNPEDFDLETLNAALASATERHNLALVTPVGVHRDMALATLRVFCEAIAARDDALARGIIGSVEPDPTPNSPSVSHVIGVTIEMVSAWHTEPAFAARTKVPAWARKASRIAAKDVLALAPKGRATAAIDSLIRRHGGLSVLEGAALAAAGTLIARASAQGTTVAALGAKLLGSAPAPAPAPAPARESAPTPRRPPAPTGSSFHRVTEDSHDRALDVFAEWLYDQPDRPEETADDEIDAFDEILTIAQSASLDVRIAAHIPQLLEMLANEISEDPVLLEALDDYVHFRIESGTDPAGWQAAHNAVEAAITESDGMVHAIAGAMARRDALPPAERGAALNETRLVSATEELLAWIGYGRPVTETGLPRRADIAVVAGMFGVEAHGSARRVAGDPTAVQSLLDLPAVLAWWDALAALGIIEITPTRVRTGRAIDTWMPTPSLEAREVLVSTYVALVLRLPEYGEDLDYLARAYVSARLAASFESVTEDLPAREMPLPASAGRRLLEDLATANVVTLDADGSLHVAPALHGLVAHGMMLAQDINRGEV